jgi:Uma2 family endonuclease
LAIEVDIARGSGHKRPIYQALGVPELWVYSDGRVSIFDLRGSQAQLVEYSLAFPTIAAEQLQAWVHLREQGTDLRVIQAVREFCRGQ